jgi:hypothetical protein
MTIYGRRKGVLDYDALYAPSLAPNATVPGRSPSGEPGDVPEDWSPVRKARPADYLLPASERWMEHLPHDVRPLALATRYPRIVNLVARQWSDRGACPAFFEELLIDRRGGRQGFPADVQHDLSKLRNYWYSQDTTLSE